jgi:predicted nucleic acid-binding protein
LGLIYLDSCIVVYVVERHPKFYSAVRAAAAAAPAASLSVSSLVQAECLVSPIRRGDAGLERRFLALFRRLHNLDFSNDIFLSAARLRATLGLRLPDALHLACARHHGCKEFWTNDHRFGVAGAGLVRVLTP